MVTAMSSRSLQAVLAKCAEEVAFFQKWVDNGLQSRLQRTLEGSHASHFTLPQVFISVVPSTQDPSTR